MSASNPPPAAAAPAAAHPKPTQTKISVPASSPQNPVDIAGIIAQHEVFAPLPPISDPSYATLKAAMPRRPVALILHGVLAHKDQIYHKKLVDALPIDSFRFDFRANHETPGSWGMAKFGDDVDDLRAVILFLRERYNYAIELIVGHSRGSIVGWAYYARFAEAMRTNAAEEHIPLWVSVAGRWRMAGIHKRDAEFNAGFEKEGVYRWKVRVAGKDREVIVRPEDVEAFAKFPLEETVRSFPTETDCLILHGTADKTVPTCDAAGYINTLTGPGRRPGSCQLCLIEDADHNLRGKFDEVVDAIVSWRQRRLASHAGSAEAAAAQRAGLPAAATSAGEAMERTWRQSTDSKVRL